MSGHQAEWALQYTFLSELNQNKVHVSRTVYFNNEEKQTGRDLGKSPPQFSRLGLIMTQVNNRFCISMCVFL